MLKFKHISDCGDATSWYSVTGAATLRNLIDEVLNDKDDEWGYITVNNIFDGIKLKYDHGRIVSNAIPDYYLDKPIKSIQANGGWSMMEYIVKFNE